MNFASAVFLALFPVAVSTPSFAQMKVESRGCTGNGNILTCDESAFRQILQAAVSIAVETPPHDPSSLRRLEKLAHALGKSVRANSADLTFVLIRPEWSGINYGPSDRELAELRIYHRAAGVASGELLWVQTYRGQPDTPWPIAVDHLVTEFREEFKR
jgi:hypothetical protein